MKEFTLERSVLVNESLDVVYEFFSDPANLQELTPPWLDFRVVGSSTEGVEVGTTIDYLLKVRGLTIRWRSLISAWNPPRSFVDEQVGRLVAFIRSEFGDERTLWIVTTLTDPKLYPKHDLAELYRRRWQAELCLRDIKTTMAMEQLRCKSPAMGSKDAATES